MNINIKTNWREVVILLAVIYGLLTKDFQTVIIILILIKTYS